MMVHRLVYVALLAVAFVGGVHAPGAASELTEAPTVWLVSQNGTEFLYRTEGGPNAAGYRYWTCGLGRVSQQPLCSDVKTAPAQPPDGGATVQVSVASYAEGPVDFYAQTIGPAGELSPTAWYRFLYDGD